MTGAAAALDRLEERLVGFGAPVAARLRPGLGAAAVAEALRDVGLPCPADMAAWWGWHDGAEIDAPDIATGPGIYYRAENQLVGNWHVATLADAVRLHCHHRDAWADAGMPELYPAGWFPLLVYVNGGLLCMDCGNGRLYVFDDHADLPADPPQLQFGSVGELADTWVRLFDDGTIVPSPHDERVPWVDFDALPPDLRAKPAYW